MKFNSIRSWLVAVVLLAVLLPALGIGAILAAVGTRRLRNQIQDSLVVLISNREEQIINQSVRYQHDLTMLAGMPELREEIAGCLRQAGGGAVSPGKMLASPVAQKLNYSLQATAVASVRFDRIFVLNSSGWVAACSQPNTVGEYRGLQKYYREGARESGLHVVSMVYSSASEAVNSLVVSIPLRDKAGKLEGVFAASPRLTSILQIVTQGSEAGPLVETYLVGKNHVLLTPLRSQTHQPGETYINYPMLEPEDMASGNVQVAVYRNYAGEQVIGAYKWMPDMQVMLVAEQPLSEAHAPIYKLLALVGTICGLTLMVVVFLAGHLLRRVTIPLSHLAETVTRIAAGDLRLRAQVTTRNEIGQLAMAFNSMTDQLQANMLGLEERVIELQETKAQLTDYAQALETEMAECKRAEDERRHIETQMLQTQKLESLGVLAGGIAHDFNNLLSGVMGNADLALLTLPEGSPQRALLDQIMVSAQRAAELTRQMLAYSGRGKFVIQPVKLCDLVREMQPLLRLSISKRCSLELHAEESQAAVEADVTQLRQVLLNLVINASEAIGGKPGVIKIHTGMRNMTRAALEKGAIHPAPREGEYATLSVSDDGSGMSDETRARIFDPFFTTKFTGRGLGLAAVLGIVRGHGGEIMIDSALGQGTQFTLCLPVGEEAEPVEDELVNAPCAMGHFTGGALLVDDEPHVLSVAEAMLSELGLTVFTAANGAEGIKQFEKHSAEINVAIIDLIMPVMDGETLMAELRRREPKLKIILCSGFTEEGMSQSGKGFNAFLSKPFNLAHLQAALEKCFGAKPQKS